MVAMIVSPSRAVAFVDVLRASSASRIAGSRIRVGRTVPGRTKVPTGHRSGRPSARPFAQPVTGGRMRGVVEDLLGLGQGVLAPDAGHALFGDDVAVLE